MAEKRRIRCKSGRFDWKKRKTGEITKDHETQTDFDDDEGLKWNEGRRIVELGLISDQLSKGCSKCKTVLMLQTCISEVRYGLGSILKLVCQCCKANNLIYTGKQHKKEENQVKGAKVWDVNTKCALAMVHIGIGPVQVENFFSVLNIPSMTPKAIKTREREIGKVIEDTARKSCHEALLEEYTKTKLAGSGTNCLSNVTSHDTMRKEETRNLSTLTKQSTDDEIIHDTRDEEINPTSNLTNNGAHHPSMLSQNDFLDNSKSVVLESETACPAKNPETRKVNASDEYVITADIHVSEGNTIKDAELPKSDAICNNNDVSNSLDESVEVKISGSFDGGWQKRGSGRSYNSLTGHATLIGEKTRKCLHYGTKSGDCRKCLFTDNASDHDCRKNFDGSAKAMESAIAVDIVSELKELGYSLETLTTDDDTTTISRIHLSVDPDIVKNSDKNHVKKNISKTLYGVKESNKSLSQSVIEYFVKNASYAISQNANDPKSLQTNLLAIVPHAYGDHHTCNAKWCGFLKNSSTYKHKDLPFGRDLTDLDLKKDLETIFEKMSNSADKLSKCGSSQANESLNFLISTKALKFKHFGGSESLDFRVGASVVQMNMGQRYVVEVNTAHGMSPGKVTVSKCRKNDAKRRKAKEKERLPSQKKRRKSKKSKKHSKTNVNEIREGTSYESGVALKVDHDIDSIPANTPKPVPCIVDVDVKNANIVFFDLETTGFGFDTEIVQIAAEIKHCDSESSPIHQTFSEYILPQKAISPKATEVTKLYSTGCSLFHNGELVKTETKKSVLERFVNWLPNKSLLAAHNCKLFDSNVLIQQIESVNLLKNLNEKILGFSDTLPMLKERFPGRKSYSQNALVTDILQETYECHNAIEDVRLLCKLIKSSDFTNLMKYSFHVKYVQEYLLYHNKKKKNLQTFNALVQQGVLTNCMRDKAAASGLCLGHLKLAVKRGGLDGLKGVLGEAVDGGKARVTRQANIVNRIFEYLSKSEDK